jgi:UPF0288 family protein (methanogenesis marker protein 3)
VLIAYFVTKTIFGNPSPEPQSDEFVADTTATTTVDDTKDSVQTDEPDIVGNQTGDVKPQPITNTDIGKLKTDTNKTIHKPDTNTIAKPKKHVNISLSDVKKMIQNGKYSRDYRISKNYRIQYTDVSDDDFGNLQQNLTNVQEQVEWGNWRDFEVVGLDYDESGKVNCIIIRPVY